ncbi:NERD domain-containing protein [Neptuniibacter marinus]|uniref:nuclease-related domain-containing protein n=1 Tax=Neptuniibacter marinus TaxID=1806670 RepID=UPI003B5A2EFB
MDVTPIINQLFSMFWYVIPLAILAGLFKSPWFKGVLGEFQVNLLLKLFLPKDKYFLIKNVTLPTEDGTTQIDHILVSKYGVFVIETKNMKGWIFASSNQKQWTQRIFKHSSKLQNPIHQNYKHIKTLESCLSIPLESIFSVIVFIGDSTFKTDMPRNVTYAGGCIKYIKSIHTEILSQNQVHDVISTIQNGRLQPGMKTNRDHVTHVKQIVSSKKSDKICPKCGSGMIIRESKRGANAGKNFWGCSTFPRCRAVVKIT